MKLTITILMNNSAFKPSHGFEVTRILRNIIRKFEGDDIFIDLDVMLYDTNGNYVGRVVVSTG